MESGPNPELIFIGRLINAAPNRRIVLAVFFTLLRKITPVAQAHEHIAPFINQTPLCRTTILNRWLDYEFEFKVEELPKVAAFKVRGALNALLSLQKPGELPNRR
jgi:threonine dehydratase